MKIIVGVSLALAGVGTIGNAQQPVVAARAETDAARATTALLGQRITFNVRGVSLIQALDSISRVSGVVVQFDVSMLASYRTPVTVHAVGVPLGVVLEQVLDGTSLRVGADGRGDLKIVSAGETTSDSVPRTGSISGRVVDSATGRGLSGAAIKVAGTKRSAISADSGRFVLKDVPLGDLVLNTRLFGYRVSERSVTVSAGQQATIRILMTSAPNVLSGVVTTATGERDRRTVGNDITVINADSVMQVAPIKTVTDLLETRVPGLTVTHTSGLPGAPSRLRLRGIGGGLVRGANSTNDPIVIVDGIRINAQQSTQRAQNTSVAGYATPAAIDQINPNAIDKIEVFKGPSASSLYGADAANGVIVITTKRGRAGKPQIGASADYGIDRLVGTYAGDGYYQFGHSLTLPESSILCGGLGSGSKDQIGLCIRDSLVVFQALNIPRLSMFGTGQNSGVSITASGGTGTFTYSLTGGATNQRGPLKMPALFQDGFVEAYEKTAPPWMRRPDTYRTWTGTGAFTSTPIPTLWLQYVASVTNSDNQQSSAQGQLATLSSTYLDTATLILTSNSPGPLLARIGNFATRVTSHKFTANHGLTARWSKWTQFPLNASAGLSTEDRQDVTTVPYGIYVGDITGGSRKGMYSYGRPTSQTRTFNLSGELFPRGRVVTTAGVNVTKQATQDVFGSVSALKPGVTIPDQLTVAHVASGSLNTGGWFIEPRLNLNSRFFVAPGFRIDNNGVASSSGGIQQTGGRGLFSLFPKMDFSWIAVDRQDRDPLLGVFTLIRPRFAFGAGAVQPEPAWLFRTYAPPSLDSAAIAQNAGYGGVQLTTVGNPLLRPERSREVEGGGEFQLWGNRVSLTATTYLKLRLDAIELLDLPPSAGGNNLQQYRNLGKVRNTGLELGLQATLLQNAAVAWTASTSYSANTNVLLTLNGSQPAIDAGNGIRWAPGYPLNGRWDRPIVGYTTPSAGQRIGIENLRIADSVAYLGSATPKYVIPTSSTLTLFGGTLGLSVAFNYEHGFTQFASGSKQLLTNLYLDSTASLGQQAAALSAYCASVYQPVQVNECGSFPGTVAGVVQTVSVLRFSTASLNYVVPRTFTRWLRVPRATIALQGSNLALWTSYRGKDPDVNGTPVGEAIEDNGQVPASRVWTLHVTLGN